ncbi:hypothetical protein FDF31_13860 [Clostridium sporogenes]|nr:hypothetical protein [Clostridium sporogenes]NFS26668.1 hypothetical protein [Clostridium sporogenes]
MNRVFGFRGSFTCLLKLKKWLSRDVVDIYFHFEEDGSIRAGSHRVKYNRNLFKIELTLI